MKTNHIQFPRRTLTLVSLLSVSAALLHAGTIAYVSISDGSVQSFTSGSTSGTQVVPNYTFGYGANGLAVDSSGNLFFANSNARTVGEVTPGGSISTFSSTSIPNLEDYSTGLAFDSSGNLYTDDSYSNSIAKIDPFGIASNYVGPDYTLNGPQGLAFDSHGNLFLADYAQIEEVSPGGGGGSVSVFKSGLGLPTSFDANLLFGLAINSSNDIFVSDPSTGQIIEVTPGGTVSTFASGLGPVRGLSFDASGNLFAVADQNYYSSGNNQILEFAAGGNTPTVFATYTGDAGQFLALANTATPEPATWSLFALCGGCLLAVRRKRARP